MNLFSEGDDMIPIRQIIDDAPDFIRVPDALRHRRVEIIIWPLDEVPDVQQATDTNGWPAGFFERTAGAWQGEPLTREPQGEYESRLELE